MVSKLVTGMVSVLLVGLASCGYSEDEWQAQLAKYEQLSQQHDQEKQAHAATRAELEEQRGRVADLTDQLEEMGFDLKKLRGDLASAGTEKEQMEASMAALRRAIDEYKQRAAVLERIKQRFELLRQKLQKLTNLGLKVSIRNNRMVISLPGDVLFASGKTSLRDAGIQVVAAVADVIRNDQQLKKRYFQIAGHTDNKPLKGGTYKDNWGLSVMRAREVLVYMVRATDHKDGGGGLDAARLHAAGYGETDPVANNDSDEGRQGNRRVELVLMPDVEEMLDLKSLI